MESSCTDAFPPPFFRAPCPSYTTRWRRWAVGSCSLCARRSYRITTGPAVTPPPVLLFLAPLLLLSLPLLLGGGGISALSAVDAPIDVDGADVLVERR